MPLASINSLKALAWVVALCRYILGPYPTIPEYISLKKTNHSLCFDPLTKITRSYSFYEKGTFITQRVRKFILSAPSAEWGDKQEEGKKKMYKVKMEHSSTATWHIIQVQTIANQFL